ncbi:MAG TPA: Gfo/Idh/MocA family oxidoreductase, partial [Candidatus Paceibacterota bacterium]|nr:Gfo/Idh/MocA family oxidoreductase [Candidatus Paceibacterota bacterium]
MSKYSVLVVGMGKRGMHHATAFNANPKFQVTGICDIDPARLADAAAKLGNPQTGTDAAALAKAVKPDVFCFCTMPHLRTPFIKAAIEAGAKLIAFEKPVALTSAELFAIRDMLRQAGVKAVVSHQHRYGKHYQKVKEIVASGALGRVHTVYGTATGWMTHMLSHLIDYTCWFNDYTPATWAMGQAAGTSKFKDNHPSPDYIAGFVQFANGVRGIYECGAGAPDQ